MISFIRTSVSVFLTFILFCTMQASAQYSYPSSFPDPIIDTGVKVIDGGGPALVPLGNGLYNSALELVYVDTLQDVALAYSTDGLHYTDVGYIHPPSGVAELSCSPSYADHCGVAAVAYNSKLYVAYNDYSCNCLRVLAGTPVSGAAIFDWTVAYNDAAHQLRTTPSMLVSADNNLIVRYGTTASGNNAYSSVLNASTGAWTIQASNSAVPTQSALFTLSGANYAIDKDSNSTYVYITQLDENGVAVSGTNHRLLTIAATLGFSATTYNNEAQTVSVASKSPTNVAQGEALQLLTSSDYYNFADGTLWGNPQYSSLLECGGSPGDFAIATYPSQSSGSAKLVVAYRGDSKGDLYASSGTVPLF